MCDINSESRGGFASRSWREQDGVIKVKPTIAADKSEIRFLSLIELTTDLLHGLDLASHQ